MQFYIKANILAEFLSFCLALHIVTVLATVLLVKNW